MNQEKHMLSIYGAMMNAQSKMNHIDDSVRLKGNKELTIAIDLLYSGCDIFDNYARAIKKHGSAEAAPEKESWTAAIEAIRKASRGARESENENFKLEAFGLIKTLQKMIDGGISPDADFFKEMEKKNG